MQEGTRTQACISRRPVPPRKEKTGQTLIFKEKENKTKQNKTSSIGVSKAFLLCELKKKKKEDSIDLFPPKGSENITIKVDCFILTAVLQV